MSATIEDLIISLEVEEEQAKRRGERSRAEIRSILEHGRAEGRANLTPQEDEDVQRAQKADVASKVDLKGIKQRLDVARRTKMAELEADEALVSRGPGGAVPLPDSGVRQRDGSRPAYDQVARIGQEERTYNRGNTGKGGKFVNDVVRQFLFRDVEAEQRLARHMQEERVERGQYLERAAGTGAFSGLVVPQYLTELYAPATSNLRPFADACNKHDLPESGMTVNISRITTPTSVALQSSENAAVSNTDIDDTLLTENVQTAAGQQTLSRQAIERGTGVEGVVMDDLYRRYAATLDSTLINQATTGLDALADLTNAYVDASPTAPELYPKVLGAASGVEAAMIGMGSADIAVMHTRRWYWMQSQLTTSFPMFSQPGISGNASGVNYATQYGSGVRGVLPSGLVVVTDNNISTTKGGGTEDRIYVVNSAECHLWEDPNAPVFIRAEQAAAASLGVLLVLYGYFAYTFRRFTSSVQAISGTGMIAPTF
jgi:hypothetical protein